MKVVNKKGVRNLHSDLAKIDKIQMKVNLDDYSSKFLLFINTEFERLNEEIILYYLLEQNIIDYPQPEANFEDTLNLELSIPHMIEDYPEDKIKGIIKLNFEKWTKHT
jgi:hypothetical protein